MTAQPMLSFDPRDAIQERFEAFHAQYPQVYAELRKLAFDYLARGFTHYSLDGLFHVVRHERNMAVGPENGYKLNNDFTSRYARLLMANEPALRGFFETRERAKEGGAWREE